MTHDTARIEFRWNRRATAARTGEPLTAALWSDTSSAACHIGDQQDLLTRGDRVKPVVTDDRSIDREGHSAVDLGL